MELTRTTTTLDDIDEKYHGLYEATDDGFRLKIVENEEKEENKTNEDVKNLLKALNKEREAHKTTKSKLKKYADNIDELNTKEKGNKENAQEQDNLEHKFNVELKKLKSQLEETQQKFNTIDQENKILKKKEIETNLKNKIIQIAAKVVDPLALPDVILRAKSELVYNAEDKEWHDKDYNYVSVKDWFEKISPNTTWLKQSKGAGSKASDMKKTEKNPFETKDYEAQAKMRRENPQLAKELQEKAKKKKTK